MISIFLASTNELRRHRTLYEEIINRLNQACSYTRVSFRDVSWNSSEGGYRGELQETFDQQIREADIFVLAIGSDLGRKMGAGPLTFSEHEFEVAIQALQSTGKPAVYVLFEERVPTSLSTNRYSKLTKLRRRVAGAGVHYKEYTDLETFGLEIERLMQLHLTKAFTPDVNSLINSVLSKTPILKHLGSMNIGYRRAPAHVKEICDEIDQLLHRGLVNAGRDLLTILESSVDCDEVRAFFHSKSGEIDRIQGRLGSAEYHLRQSLHIYGLLGDQTGICGQLESLGILFKKLGEFDRALHFYSRALALLNRRSPDWRPADFHGHMGAIDCARGNFDDAVCHHEKALNIYIEGNHEPGIALANANIGAVHLARGELDSALHRFRTTLDMDVAAGRLIGISIQNWNIGMVLRRLKRHREATNHFATAYAIDIKLDRREGIAANTANLALISRDEGRFADAERLHREALRMETEIGHCEGIASELFNLGDLLLATNRHLEAGEFLAHAQELYMKLGAEHRVNAIATQLRLLHAE